MYWIAAFKSVPLTSVPVSKRGPQTSFKTKRFVVLFWEQPVLPSGPFATISPTVNTASSALPVTCSLDLHNLDFIDRNRVFQRILGRKKKNKSKNNKFLMRMREGGAASSVYVR